MSRSVGFAVVPIFDWRTRIANQIGGVIFWLLLFFPPLDQQHCTNTTRKNAAKVQYPTPPIAPRATLNPPNPTPAPTSAPPCLQLIPHNTPPRTCHDFRSATVRASHSHLQDVAFAAVLSWRPGRSRRCRVVRRTIYITPYCPQSQAQDPTSRPRHFWGGCT